LIIADASVLISLSRTGRLNILQRLYGEVMVAPAVRLEALGVRKEARAPAQALIEAGFAGGWLREIRLTAKEQEQAASIMADAGLHRGEAESIAAGMHRRLPVILDDKEARLHAAAAAIEFTGTAGVLYEGYRAGILDMTQLERAVRDLADVMWLSPLVVAEVLRRAREVYQ
jgi:predicted nucleic acid-binding protein